MKKLLIGCGVLMFIGVVALGIGAKIIWNKTFAGVIKVVEQIEETNVAYPFTPRQDQLISAQQLDSGFAILTPLIDELSVSVTELNQEMAKLNQQTSQKGPGFGKPLGIISTAINMVIEPMENTLALLEEHKMSMDELLWIWSQINAVIAETDLDLSNHPELQAALEDHREIGEKFDKVLSDIQTQVEETGGTKANQNTQTNLSKEQTDRLLKLLAERRARFEELLSSLKRLNNAADALSSAEMNGEIQSDAGIGSSLEPTTATVQPAM